MPDDATKVRKLLRQQAAIAAFGSFALRQSDLLTVLMEAARVWREQKKSTVRPRKYACCRPYKERNKERSVFCSDKGGKTEGVISPRARNGVGPH
jgi:hypothetical protein